MSELKILNKVRTILGMELELATAKLEDGETTIEFETLEAGEPVHIITEDEQKIALPKGEYKMEDGRIVCVEEEGIIYEIKDGEEEKEEEKEDEPKDEPKEETEAGYGDKEEEEEMSTEEVKPVKKTVESIVKETFFSDIEALVKENEELKAKIEELEAPKTELSEEVEEEVKEEANEEANEEVELSSEEPAETPIVHNPEASNEVKTGFKYGSQNTTLNKIFKRINK